MKQHKAGGKVRIREFVDSLTKEQMDTLDQAIILCKHTRGLSLINALRIAGAGE